MRIIKDRTQDVEWSPIQVNCNVCKSTLELDKEKDVYLNKSGTDFLPSQPNMFFNCPVCEAVQAVSVHVSFYNKEVRRMTRVVAPA